MTTEVAMWKGIGLVALTLAFEGAFLLQVALPSGLGGDAPRGYDQAVVVRRASPAPAAPVVPAMAPAAPASPCPSATTATRS
jgi:hypothetical protein